MTIYLLSFAGMGAISYLDNQWMNHIAQAGLDREHPNMILPFALFVVGSGGIGEQIEQDEKEKSCA